MNKKLLSILLAVVCAGVAQADDFTWVGGATGNWDETANWSKTSGSSTRGYPNNRADNATFGKTAAVDFNKNNRTVGRVTLNSDVTFTGGKYLSVYTGVGGTGTLTLSGASLRAPTTGAETPIDVPLVMADGTANELLNVPKAYFVVKGPLRGKGEVAIHSTTPATTASNVGTILKGDNSEFGGTIKFYPYSTQKADRPSIGSAQAASTNATWEINVQAATYTGLTPGTDFFGTPDETYKFGALKANFYYNGDDNAYWATAGVTLEVGGLDLDGYAKGTCAPGDGVIDWVGESATFTNEVSNLAQLRLSGGGNLVIGAANAVPTAITFAQKGGVLSLASGVTADVSPAFKDSTVPIVFDDRGVNHTWATGPDASNVGGFVKRGAGTLTWAAAPASPIDVTVSEGVLAVPFGTRLGRVVIADGAILKVDTTGHAAGIAFVAASSDRPLDDTRLVFDPKPAALKVVPGVDNGAAYVMNSKAYVWRGPTSDANWSTAANWDPNGVPEEQDTVAFTNASVAQTVIDYAAAALTVDATNHLALGGSFALTAASYLALAGDLTLVPNPMSGETGADAYGAANRLGVAATSLSARSVAGEGFVTAAGSDLVGLAEAGTTNGFVGTLTARNFTKTGAGVYALIGEGAFSGTLAVEEGTLRLGTYRDLYNCRYDFDASDTASFTEQKEGGKQVVTTWKSQVGGYVFQYNAGDHAQKTNAWDLFGGKNTVCFRPKAAGADYSRYVLVPDNAASGCASKSLFFVYRPMGFVESLGLNRGYLYGEKGVGGLNVYTSRQWEWKFGTDSDSTGIFMGSAYGVSRVEDVEALAFWSDAKFDMGAGHEEQLGTQDDNKGFKGVIAEVVAFTNTLTQVEREVATKQLMHKWGLGYADYQPLKPTASVTMKAGATLDLGGQTVAVAGFEGAGVVTNGVLDVAHVVQKGGALSMPAVEGATYTMSKIGEKLVLRDAEEKAVTIIVPRDWSKAGLSGFEAVFCQGEVNWEFPGWAVKPVPVCDGNGWWSIPAGGSALRLR